ncbi:unnamed protein product [Urochloa decumbens]|uniref:Agglutinin domain-containing protein n=1 Tax=Urochloa decumbens TaxID=240449 RepID=A0ABC8ZBU6_9POAL
MFSVINLEGLVLPKHICFKGVNGKYISAQKYDWDWNINYLEFTSDDIADPTVENIIRINSDGTIRIRSSHFGKFWRRSPDWQWIWVDSDDTSNRDLDTLFQVVMLGDGTKCALRNLGSNLFCKMLSKEGKTNCLGASVRTIAREAILELHETVISRRIYNVEYQLNHVNIHDLKPRTFYSNTIANNSGKTYKSKLTIAYGAKREMSWNSTVLWKLAVGNTTITAGVPALAEGSVEISSEFSGPYNWGETKPHTENHKNEEEVEMPAHTELTVSVVGTEGICDIPFSYYQEDLFTTGARVVTKNYDGIYRGVNSYGFKTVITD